MAGAEKQIEVLEMIAADMKNDARDFDGRPFNGKVVASYFGNQGAAIAALADIMKSILEQSRGERRWKYHILGIKLFLRWTKKN